MQLQRLLTFYRTGCECKSFACQRSADLVQGMAWFFQVSSLASLSLSLVRAQSVLWLHILPSSGAPQRCLSLTRSRSAWTLLQRLIVLRSIFETVIQYSKSWIKTGVWSIVLLMQSGIKRSTRVAVKSSPTWSWTSSLWSHVQLEV